MSNPCPFPGAKRRLFRNNSIISSCEQRWKVIALNAAGQDSLCFLHISCRTTDLTCLALSVLSVWPNCLWHLVYHLVSMFTWAEFHNQYWGPPHPEASPWIAGEGWGFCFSLRSWFRPLSKACGMSHCLLVLAAGQAGHNSGIWGLLGCQVFQRMVSPPWGI